MRPVGFIFSCRPNSKSDFRLYDQKCIVASNVKIVVNETRMETAKCKYRRAVENYFPTLERIIIF